MSGEQKARSLLQNFGQLNAKTADKFLATCLPFEAVILLYGSSNLFAKQNSRFISTNMHLEIPAFGQQKTPIKSGFMRNISFLCSYYGGSDGNRTHVRKHFHRSFSERSFCFKVSPQTSPKSRLYHQLSR